MKKILIVAISILVISPLTLAKEPSANATPFLEFSPMSEMRAEAQMAYQQRASAQRDTAALTALHNHPDYILPKKVLLFSAIIPGAGELFAGSYLKSALFFGIEVGAWAMYAYYNKQGNEKEDEFEAYADTYWDESKWVQWYGGLTDEEQDVFSHELPEEKTQQYYEMIGKYNQFLVGWDEVPIDLTTTEIHEPENTSPLREEYMDMRDESNQLFKRATSGIYIAMFNHVLSAIDAAWTAKRHNSKLVIETSLRMENKYFNNHNHQMLSLRVKW
ncbi:hypothetical protein GF337_03840 [candidate division KSB1 bacterium]|nr:hypothetical protein [candidate division KSB1 bacterium]